MKTVILSGGVGGARMAQGLMLALGAQAEELTVIVNTGDDLEMMGLSICPDIDTNLYTLAGLNHEKQGWGLEGDTYACLDMLKKLGAPVWFSLGDRDLALQIRRHELLTAPYNYSLSQCTDELRRSLGIPARIVPMSDLKRRTMISTPEGCWDFQTYFVARGHRDRVLKVTFEDIEPPLAAPEALHALEAAQLIVLAPSNPFVSLNPILTLPGIKEALIQSSALRVAVSPLIGGRAIKGPLAEMLESLDYPVNNLAIAGMYADFLDTFIIDHQDAAETAAIEALNLTVVSTNIFLPTPTRRRDLGSEILALYERR